MEERLQKYMASCGVASRRKCEEIILQGRVKVNDKTISELGSKVNNEKDIVTVDDKLIKKEENKVYIALNKPQGYVSTVKDEKGRETILDLVNVEQRVYPIGRLDCDTSGLILLTNDGDIYNKIAHPREEKSKIYMAEVQGILNEDDIKKFEEGISIDGYITAPAEMKILGTFIDSSDAEIIIHEGKNKQIRKMCDAINHPVIELQRVQIGKIKLGDLPLGKWRHLTSEELESIKDL